VGPRATGTLPKRRRARAPANQWPEQLRSDPRVGPRRITSRMRMGYAEPEGSLTRESAPPRPRIQAQGGTHPSQTRAKRPAEKARRPLNAADSRKPSAQRVVLLVLVDDLSGAPRRADSRAARALERSPRRCSQHTRRYGARSAEHAPCLSDGVDRREACPLAPTNSRIHTPRRGRDGVPYNMPGRQPADVVVRDD
jgi:hypothetical protein